LKFERAGQNVPIESCEAGLTGGKEDNGTEGGEGGIAAGLAFGGPRDEFQKRPAG
jgi:hypothetical protein